MHVTVIGAVVLAALPVMACASSNESVPSSPSPSGRQEVLAPIDGVAVQILESNPPQYMLNVRAGLPSGCAGKNPPCTAIYGSYELNINFGSDFRRGTTYSVNVNDKRTSFVAK